MTEDIKRLERAIQMLSNIRPPVAFTETIGLPVFQALMLIDSVRKNLESAQQEEEIGISDVQVTQEDPGADVEEIPTEGVLFNQNGNNE